jgi:peptidoglycan/LPS O-acetylase OafA/YrhL
MMPAMRPERRPPRIRVNLAARLPRWVRWTLALTIVAAVFMAAWVVGRDDPIPEWISRGLVPALGWAYLVLLAVAGVHLIRKRLARRSEGKEGSQ